MLEKAVEYSHQLLHTIVQEEDTVIDATVGNGKDTLLLAELVGKMGKVIGFDVQQKAIDHTYARLNEIGLQKQVDLHQVGHEQVEFFLSKEDTISAAIFNLGYLPGGNKNITTQKETTLKSVSAILPFLKIGGLLLLVVYSGHPNGLLEKDALLTYVKELDQSEYTVLLYQFINQKNSPPFLIVIEKRK